MRDVQSALAAGASRVLIGEKLCRDPFGRDFLASTISLLAANGKGNASAQIAQKESSAPPASSVYGNSGTAQSRSTANPKLFFTPEAEAIKIEICAVGRKLWMRQFVDGNGGNISYRIGPMRSFARPRW